MRPLALLLCLGLGACEAPAEPARKPPATAPRLAAPFQDGPISVSEAGVGPIGPSTPFSAEAIAALFPDAAVTAGELMDGEHRLAIITVIQPGLALRIDRDPDQPLVGRVHALGGAVGPRGEPLLSPWTKTPFEAGQCRNGLGADLGAAVCRRTADSHIRYTFNVSGWGGAGAPPAELLAAHGFLREIVWERAPPAV